MRVRVCEVVLPGRGPWNFSYIRVRSLSMLCPISGYGNKARLEILD